VNKKTSTFIYSFSDDVTIVEIDGKFFYALEKENE